MKILIALFLTAIITLFTGINPKNRQWLNIMVILGLLVSMFLIGFEWINPSSTYSHMLNFDHVTLSFTGLILVATLLISLLSGFGLRGFNNTYGDHMALVLFSLCGALCMLSFTNVFMLFLGIEILSIPLYILAGSDKKSLQSNEASLKYFIMGAFATGILLFGIALIYGATGSFDLQVISSKMTNITSLPSFIYVGIIMLIMGMSFKISAAPFHFWSPDVYDGAPTLITAFMATVVKIAGIYAFYTMMVVLMPGSPVLIGNIIIGISILTMFVANLTAVYQKRIKRMLAYSSISHAGYLLMALLAGAGAERALFIYTATYAIATIAIFAIVIFVTEQSNDFSFKAFNGFAKRQPAMALVLAFCLLSLAGIPPTPGFFGKYLMFSSVFEAHPVWVLLAIVNSAISIYYYFKIIIAMYFKTEDELSEINFARPNYYGLVVGLAMVILLAFTIFIDFWSNLIGS